MKVRLISHSTPNNIIGIDDAQDLIAYCARVSNPDNIIGVDDDQA